MIDALVCPDRYQPTLDSPTFRRRTRDPDVCPFGEALSRQWPTDAHVTQYEAPLVNGVPLRLSLNDPAAGVAPKMVMLLGDLDGPGHVASPEWRAETEPRLDASGLGWYATRGGYRVFAPLETPITISCDADADAWSARYRAWCADVQAQHGLALDTRTVDWTRLFRLPNVKRDGVPVRAEVHAPRGPVSLPEIGTIAPAPRAQVNADDARVARAHALAERLEPSVEGHGGDASLFRAANELATILGADAAAIRLALDTFNARCAPPWDVAKLDREAARAADRARDHYGSEWRAIEASQRATRTPAEDIDWNGAEQPVEWYCRGLAIAPSERKVTLIAGDPGAGKGPLADYLAVCFALGQRVFGVHDVRPARVGILDFEGARLSARRVRSYARGLGFTPADLSGRLFLRDADPGVDANWIAEWCAARSVGVLVIDSYMSAMAMSEAEPNSPQYATLARDLGSLGIVVLIVAHARKPPQVRTERPSLGDVAGSYALGGMAATALSVWNPDDDKRLETRIGCMRAPEEAFPTFDLRWEKSGSDEAPVWRPTIVGVATREARAEAQARIDAKIRDDELTEACGRVIKYLESRTAPVALFAIREAVHRDNADTARVLGLLVDAGVVLRSEAYSGRAANLYAIAPGGPFRIRVSDGAVTLGA